MTIYGALTRKLGRLPTNKELRADVKRIMNEALIERAEAGKLPWQQKRRKLAVVGRDRAWWDEGR